MTSMSVIRAALLRGSAASAILPAALIGGLLTTSPAMAQDTALAQNSTAATGSPDASDTNKKDIVVTGTLFRRTDTETPSPVTILSADNLKKAGITAETGLRSIAA